MEQNILFVGLDVDDNTFHAHLIVERTGECFSFSCKPQASVLLKKLKSFSAQGFTLHLCYEATYLGNSLYRAISAAGIKCDVVAPSLIPISAGNQIKTDRLDSEKLCLYFMKGLLTPIHIPEIEDEVDRDVIRSRSFLMGQLKAVRAHILSVCRRSGWDFKGETDYKGHWTQLHISWLQRKIDSEKNEQLKFNLNSLLLQTQQIKSTIDSYDEQIVKMSKEGKYKKKTNALLCYRGIETLTAMTFITEIGDIQRFRHPRQLVSYVGLDVKEYSSGGKERRFGITKLGNGYLRRALVESSQTAYRKPAVSRALTIRRKDALPHLVDIGDRCMKRLYKKGTRLIFSGKNINKVKVACAREAIGFIWESLRAAA